MTCSGEFLKIRPGTGDNLSPEDIAAGFTDYVIWNRFKPTCLDIDGELPMECTDSGMVLIDPSTSSLRDSAQDDARACEGTVTVAFPDSDLECDFDNESEPR